MGVDVGGGLVPGTAGKWAGFEVHEVQVPGLLSGSDDRGNPLGQRKNSRVCRVGTIEQPKKRILRLELMLIWRIIEKSPFDEMVEVVRSYIGRNGGFKRIAAWGQYADA